jgi:error-prone DNA polymerase
MTAILNNQPMGFYSPHTLVKDAQRHGLHFLPVDVTRSVHTCAIEQRNGELAVRLGFNYVKGFSRLAAEAIVSERERAPFENINDLKRRLPRLSKDELRSLAELGALNEIDGSKRHRRDALWQTELALRPVSRLLADASPPETPSPLLPMNPTERLQADFQNSGLSIGAHPMRFHRQSLYTMGVYAAAELKGLPDGEFVSVAGAVICRQQPGTAKGFVFLSLEDETGVANIIVKPNVFQSLRTVIVGSAYLLVEGILQDTRGVCSVRASTVRPYEGRQGTVVSSHDFR